MAGEVGFDGGGEEREDVAALLAAGFNHGEHGLDEAITVHALAEAMHGTRPTRRAAKPDSPAMSRAPVPPECERLPIAVAGRTGQVRWALDML